MAKHLRFVEKEGIVESKTVNGRWTEELLQLNDPQTIAYRKNAFLIIEMCRQRLRSLAEVERELVLRLKRHELRQDIFDGEMREINECIADTQKVYNATSGELLIPPISEVKMNQRLVK